MIKYVGELVFYYFVRQYDTLALFYRDDNKTIVVENRKGEDIW